MEEGREKEIITQKGYIPKKTDGGKGRERRRGRKKMGLVTKSLRTKKNLLLFAFIV